MDPAKFEETVSRGMSMLTVLCLAESSPEIRKMLPGQPLSYNAHLDDTEVAVIGYLRDDPDDPGHTLTTAVAVLVTEELFARLRTDGESARYVANVLRPPKTRTMTRERSDG